DLLEHADAVADLAIAAEKQSFISLLEGAESAIRPIWRGLPGEAVRGNAEVTEGLSDAFDLRAVQCDGAMFAIDRRDVFERCCGLPIEGRDLPRVCTMRERAS